MPGMNIEECGWFDVWVSKLGRFGTTGLFVGRDISTNEILGLSGLGLGTDIPGGLPFIAGLGILFRVGIGILGIRGLGNEGMPIGGRGILGISGMGKMCMPGKSGLESAGLPVSVCLGRFGIENSGMLDISGLVFAGFSSISGSEITGLS